MMRAFALSLDLPEEVFLQATNQPIARSSVIYYPPQPSDLGETQFGVAPHRLRMSNFTLAGFSGWVGSAD